MKIKQWGLLLASSMLLLSACSPTEEAAEEVSEASSIETTAVVEETLDTAEEAETEDTSEDSSVDTTEDTSKDTSEEAEASDRSDSTGTADSSKEAPATETTQSTVPETDHQLTEVYGGDLSGHREANVVVDIGFGDREYWAFTNEHGQLVRVVAEEIILQDDDSEPVNSNGRYYHDEAKVPGTESSSLDEGHIIADSLGGVANAYNITPQNSTLNRHGDQAYMERNIQQAGGATDFEAIITYPDTTTQIPSSYKYTYTIKGNRVVDEFENINPDEYNEEQGLTGGSEDASSNESSSSEAPKEEPKEDTSGGGDVSSVDANGNGRVTIQEAKDAGFSMPITSDHWLYQYMDDRDGDGMVGE